VRVSGSSQKTTVSAVLLSYVVLVVESQKENTIDEEDRKHTQAVWGETSE
jgi:hypothetical protein